MNLGSGADGASLVPETPSESPCRRVFTKPEPLADALLKPRLKSSLREGLTRTKHRAP